MGVVEEDVVGVVEDMYSEVFDDVLEVVRGEAESLAGIQCTRASFKAVEEAGLVKLKLRTGRGAETRWVDIRGATLVEEHVVELCDNNDCLPVVTVDRLYVEGRCYYKYYVNEDAIDIWVCDMLEEYFPDLMDEYWRSEELEASKERRHKKLTEYLK